jgi:hypothetical protein
VFLGIAQANKGAFLNRRSPRVPDDAGNSAHDGRLAEHLY